MILLAVETTSSSGSLVLAKLNTQLQILAHREWKKKSSHSEIITTELSTALAQAALTLDDITHFAVDVGPGSFTGIRVGINLVRTLAYASQKPTRIFCSLEVLAFQLLKPDQSAVIAIPAVQDFFYAGVYRRRENFIETIFPPESRASGGLQLLSDETKAQLLFSNVEPKAETLAQMIFADPQKSHFHSWKHIVPLYIRKSEAEEKLLKGLLKPVR